MISFQFSLSIESRTKLVNAYFTILFEKMMQYIHNSFIFNRNEKVLILIDIVPKNIWRRDISLAIKMGLTEIGDI